MAFLKEQWPYFFIQMEFYLEVSSFKTRRGMVFLAVAGVDIFEGVFDLIGGGGDQAVAALVKGGLTIQKVSGEGNDLGHVLFSENLNV